MTKVEIVKELKEIEKLLGMTSDDFKAYCARHNVPKGNEYAYLTGVAWAMTQTLLEKVERKRENEQGNYI